MLANPLNSKSLHRIIKANQLHLSQLGYLLQRSLEHLANRPRLSQERLILL